MSELKENGLSEEVVENIIKRLPPSMSKLGERLRSGGDLALNLTPMKGDDPLNLWGYEPTLKDLCPLHPKVRPLAYPTSELTQDPANARYHSMKNYEATKQSIIKFGQRQVINVRLNNKIITAGNLRQKIFSDLNWPYIAALLSDDDSMTATAFAIADNRTGELADWDYENLLPQLETLDGEWGDMSGTGFTGHDVEFMKNASGFEDDWGQGLDDIDELGEDDEMSSRIVVKCKPMHRDSVKRQINVALKGIEGVKIE